MTVKRQFAATLVISVLFAFGAVPAEPPAIVAAPPAGIYKYTVSHSLHGAAGSFSNAIRREGDTVVVESRLRITAGLLGVELYRLAEDRREVWRAGRLVEYESRADDDGEIIVTRGRAEDGKFRIESAAGTTDAPAKLRTTNPWSENIVRASVLMGTKRGELNAVAIAYEAVETLDLGGRTVTARRYRVTGDMARQLWFNRRGVMVKQSFPARGGTISFTLRPD